MIIYVAKDGNIKVDVNIKNEDIWMSQDVMANLYDTTKQNISYHLNNIFKENELNKDSVVKDFLTGDHFADVRRMVTACRQASSLSLCRNRM